MSKVEEDMTAIREAQATQLLCRVIDHISSESVSNEAQLMYLDSSLHKCTVSAMTAGWGRGCGALTLCLRYVQIQSPYEVF
jgi:hypothetical protein